MNNYINQQFSLHNKVAIVTGGTGVLGSQMATALALAGAKVGILGRREEEAEKVCREILVEGGDAIALIADVTSTTQLEEVEKKILGIWGRIDILVNAAGGNIPGATIKPEQTIFDLKLNDLSQVINLNLLGSIIPMQVLCKDMCSRKDGVIINISSMAAQRAITRVMGYSVAKAAIENLTKWMATELALKYGEKIRVNAIAPGFFIGEQNRRLLTNEDGTLTKRGETVINQTPMKRFGEPDELGGTLIWLCSEASKFVTGIVVPVDGGFSSFSGV